MFKIEKNVPLPPPRKHQTTTLRLSIAAMEVGDCLVIPAGVYSEKNRGGASAATGLGRRLGFTLTARRQPDGSVRVWRTA